jgi:hypothetical protein
VARVQLGPVEARAPGPFGGGGELLDHPLEILFRGLVVEHAGALPAEVRGEDPGLFPRHRAHEVAGPGLGK